MNKTFISACLAFTVLTGCNDTKDAQYFYDNPEALKAKIADCEARAKKAVGAELDKLAKDAECEAATVATFGVHLGDLKKAMIDERTPKWKDYIDYLRKTSSSN